jgi:hypothetical protein
MEKSPMAAKALALISVVFLVLFPTSCMDVFTNSWGSALKRDPDKLIPKVTTSNVGELLDASVGDPEFAAVLLGKIRNSVENTTGKDKAILQDAGLKAAVEASGLAAEFINNAGELLKTESAEGVKNSIDTILKNLDTDRSISIANNLLDILDDETAFKEFSEASNGDLAVAAVVLLIGEVKKSGGTLDDYLDDFLNRKLDENILSKEEKKALFLANQARNSNNDLIDQLLESMDLL